MIRLPNTTEYLLSTRSNRKRLNIALDGLKKPDTYISTYLMEL